MKITEQWKRGNPPTLSFELLPPRTPKAAETLEKMLSVLPELKPDFVSVTFGAGGSTRQGSRELVKRLKHDLNLDVIAYFAGLGLCPEDVRTTLDAYREIGVRNILAVRGDKPEEDKLFVPHPKSFAHASDLVAFIRPQYDFCLGVAGYPEGHVACESPGKDIEYLKQKIDNGGEFIIANYFYDNRYFFDYLEAVRKAGITVPVLPGIMPIYSIKMMEILSGICGATITGRVRQGIAALPEGDTQALIAFGIDVAVEQCEDLLKAGVPGLHFYTMNRSTSVAGIIKALKNHK